MNNKRKKKEKKALPDTHTKKESGIHSWVTTLVKAFGDMMYFLRRPRG
jgi:hypothetical protein